MTLNFGIGTNVYRRRKNRHGLFQHCFSQQVAKRGGRFLIKKKITGLRTDLKRI